MRHTQDVHGGYQDETHEAYESATDRRMRSGLVRRSMLSREVLVVALLLGMGGFVAANLTEKDTQSGFQNQSLRGHDTLVESIRYSPDGATLVSCGWDKRVRVWDVDAQSTGWGQETETLIHDWHISGIAMSPDGKLLVASGSGGFSIWRLNGFGHWELQLSQPGEGNRCAAASPDGRTIAVATAGKSIQIWDLESMRRVAEIRDLHDDLRRIEYSPDGCYLAASTFDGRFGVWRLRKGESPVKLENLPESVQNYTFTLDGNHLVVARWGDEHKDLVVWDIESGRESLRLSNNAMGVNDLAISPDGRTLASAEKDRSIRIWNLSTGVLKSTIHDEVGWVKTVAFSPDGRRLAFGGQDGLVKFRDLGQQMTPTIVKSKKASDDVG